MMNMIRKKKARKGFTLVELVVVVAIIAILTAVAAPRFMSMTDGSKVSSVQTSINAIKTAITMYQANGGLLSDIATDNDKILPYINNVATGADFATHFDGNPAGSSYSFSGDGSTSDPLVLEVQLEELGDPTKFADPRNGVEVDSSGDILIFTYSFK